MGAGRLHTGMDSGIISGRLKEISIYFIDLKVL